jgi:hypothetical protein
MRCEKDNGFLGLFCENEGVKRNLAGKCGNGLPLLPDPKCSEKLFYYCFSAVVKCLSTFVPLTMDLSRKLSMPKNVRLG